MSERAAAVTLLVIASALAGCVGPAAEIEENEIRLPLAAEAPDAGRWSPLVLPRADAVRPPAPPAAGSPEAARDAADLAAAVAARTAEDERRALEWSEDFATKPWTELQIRLITQFKQSPPRAARALALSHAAMYDAVVATWDAKAAYNRSAPPTAGALFPVPDQPSYPSEHAAVAAAAAAVLAEMYPQQGAAWFEAQAEEAARLRVAAGVNWPSDVEAGLAIGRAVAERVLAQAVDDGSELPWEGEPPAAGPCTWAPTPPLFIQTPLEPRWGEVRPFFMANGSQFRPPPPPDCTEIEGETEYRMVYQIAHRANERQVAVGAYWADGPDASGPPAHWNRIALDLADKHALNTPQAARMFAYMNGALMDAGISVWDAKYAYWSVRPVTWIQRELDPTFRTSVVTPPFPGYVSGHSGFSAAASRTLQHFLPEEQVYLRALATEAAMARMYSGIHTPSDDEVGVWMGYQIGQLVEARAKADGGWAGGLVRPEAQALTHPPESSRWAFLTEGTLKGEGSY